MGKHRNTFTFINEKNQFSKEFIDLLDNKPIINNLHTLQHYLERENFTYSKVDLDKAVLRFEKSILKQATYFSFLDYYVREQSQEWGDPGEEQVKTSFCRLILKKKPEDDLSYTVFIIKRTKIS